MRGIKISLAGYFSCNLSQTQTEKKALIPLYSQAPVIQCGWGCTSFLGLPPQGRSYHHTESMQSPHHTQGPQLRIMTVPVMASEMSSPSLHFLGMKEQGYGSKSQENVPATALTDFSKAEE